jgi:aryl-alcohol dehydrogenase-like predicted oxidoreductase
MVTVHREVEEMLPTLTELRITLVAHSPLGHGQLQDVSGSPLAQALRDVAARHNVSSGQVALAWVHSQGRQLNQAVTPLAGTTRISHLRENLAAASLQLATEDVRKLSAAAA